MNNNGFCTVVNKTKGYLPRCPFVSIKNEILGQNYDLEIIFLTSAKQKKINNTYRKKNQTTNILSFSLSKTCGQITFDPIKVKNDAPLFNMTYPKFLKYLLIHGCLHLKGFEHSSTMDKQEKKYLRVFK